MNNEKGLVPKVFTHEHFGKLRMVVIDNVPHFVGKDVATSLEYKNTREAIRYHVDARDKREEKILLPSGVQKTILINKSGVYSLILDSNMPKAKEYRHWVTSEVLPTIDETGSYSRTADPALAVKLDLARVYLLLLSDGTVQILKIGQSKNVRARVAKIERETGLNVVDIYFTPFMPREIARLVEWTSQKKLSAWHVKGEFFSVEFEEARKVIDYSVEIAFAKLPDTLGREENFLQTADK